MIYKMKLSQVKDLLDAKVYAGENMLDTEVKEACGSDLMSDVLAFVKDEALLLTGLQNLQVLRTAEMMDIRARKSSRTGINRLCKRSRNGHYDNRASDVRVMRNSVFGRSVRKEGGGQAWLTK